MPVRNGSRHVIRYLTGVGLFICLLMICVFWAFFQRSAELIRQQMLNQGRAFFEEILLTRQWMASHGGVYVRLEPGDTVNPYLQQIPGLQTTIRDENGHLYALKNPALVTREISELASKKGLFSFRITSLQPLNPANAPDPFEQDALRRFSQGAREVSASEVKDGQEFFRYMAPLVTTRECLSCHGQQGYKEGDVRGGISVTSSATATMEQVRESRSYLIASVALLLLAVMSGLFLSARRLLRDLRTAEHKLLEMATRDFLTGLPNRRETCRLLEESVQRARRTGEPFAVLSMDVDRFKQINDLYGHAAGDKVLQAVADAMRSGFRPYDPCCRYGGEEFLVMLPGAGLVQAVAAAERFRLTVSGLDIVVSSETTLRISASIGIAVLADGESADQLVSRADAAMYQSKQQGRDRVSLSQPPAGSP